LVILLCLTANTFAAPVPAKVLFVGDSHSVLVFGDVFFRELSQRYRGQIATYSSCGSTLRHWLTGLPTKCGYRERGLGGNINVPYEDIHSGKVPPPHTPLLSKLLKKHDPKIVIIQLGSNYISHGISELDGHISAVMPMLGHRACIWIGPPDARAQPKKAGMDLTTVNQFISEKLRALGSRCVFIDSLAITKYPDLGGDGLHYDWAGEPGAITENPKSKACEDEESGRNVAICWAKKAAQRITNHFWIVEDVDDLLKAFFPALRQSKTQAQPDLAQ
jgi:hypothetical protein